MVGGGGSVATGGGAVVGGAVSGGAVAIPGTAGGFNRHPDICNNSPQPLFSRHPSILDNTLADILRSEKIPVRRSSSGSAGHDLNDFASPSGNRLPCSRCWCLGRASWKVTTSSL